MESSPGPGDYRLMLGRRALLGTTLGALALSSSRARAAAGQPLLVGDQKGGVRSLLSAAGAAVPATSINWVLFAGAPMLIQAMTAGAVEVGAIGDAPLVFAQAGGSPIRAVAGLRTDGTTTALVVQRDSAIRSIADLKGKRVATLRAQTGHYLTLAALREAGLPDDAVNFVFIPPTSAKLALQTGAVDAWATWGPYIADAKISDGAREIVNGGKLMSGLSYIVARQDTIAARPDAVAAYLRALSAGYRWMGAHEDLYAATWAGEVGLSVPVAREVVRGMRGSIVPLTPEVVTAQQHVADFMAATRMIPSHLDVQAAMDTSFRF
ncbi:aliphatic sulfonate ABC transporter substrate-binding protein [Asaia astilbis]|uniref:aliphatic sulfonate ABC transporter substrate-binding protein n=1 Tax=Asaia astilbis TaxID=610244 RepID=UPI0006887625|nr:aliphatic sulfonate ABC transporter substrate-binding protein [Asaia astilbis]